MFNGCLLHFLPIKCTCWHVTVKRAHFHAVRDMEVRHRCVYLPYRPSPASRSTDSRVLTCLFLNVLTQIQ